MASHHRKPLNEAWAGECKQSLPRHPQDQSKSCHQECGCHSTDIMHMQGKPYAEERQPPVVFWWIRSWWYGIYRTQVCVCRSLWYSHSMLLATTIFMTYRSGGIAGTWSNYGRCSTWISWSSWSLVCKWRVMTTSSGKFKWTFWVTSSSFVEVYW